MKIKKKSQQGFMIINNDIFRDDDLSWKAKGLFGYLWSLPDDWDFYETELVKHAPDGRTSLRSGLKELEKAGYLTRSRHREKGKVQGSIWILSDTKEPVSEKRMSEKRMSEKRMSENRTLLNTNHTNNLQDKINNNTNHQSNQSTSNAHSSGRSTSDSSLLKKERNDLIEGNKNPLEKISLLKKELQSVSGDQVLQEKLNQIAAAKEAGKIQNIVPYTIKVLSNAIENAKLSAEILKDREPTQAEKERQKLAEWKKQEEYYHNRTPEQEAADFERELKESGQTKEDWEKFQKEWKEFVKS